MLDCKQWNESFLLHDYAVISIRINETGTASAQLSSHEFSRPCVHHRASCSVDSDALQSVVGAREFNKVLLPYRRYRNYA